MTDRPPVVEIADFPFMETHCAKPDDCPVCQSPAIPDLPGNVYAALSLAATAAQSGVFAKQHIAAGHADDAAREARWAYHDAIRAYRCASGLSAVDVLAPNTCSCEAARKKDVRRDLPADSSAFEAGVRRAVDAMGRLR